MLRNSRYSCLLGQRLGIGGAFLHAGLATDQSLLGAVLVERGMFAKAAPLLLTSYQTISDDRTANASLKQKYLKRVVGLYEAWDKATPNSGKATEAVRWRALLRPAESLQMTG
jgi:hypothetical protein